MLRGVAIALALVLAGCAGATPPPGPAPILAAEAPPVLGEVVRDAGGWTLTYRFPRDAPAWAFIRSAPAEVGGRSWRGQSWTVETPGVRLERIGRYDVLVAERGNVPRTLRIRFTPFTAALAADYVPALAFSDGTTAIFDDHFAIFSLASAAAAADLPTDLNGAPIEDSGTRVTFRDTAGSVMHRGDRSPAVTLQNATSYVLFGARTPVESPGMSAIIEPQLPAWLQGALREMIPAILDRYRAELGPAPGGRPMLLASWAGPTPDRGSMNGGVVRGTILMRFEGEGVLRDSRQLRHLARWFTAHEGAHFWLGQAVRYERSADAWIMEGGADLLAVRTVQAIDPSYDWRAKLNTALSECVEYSRGRGIASAEDRGEHQAYYACGAAFALVAEAASGRPFSAFVRELVDANRADGVLTRAEWLAALDRASGNPALRLGIERFLDHGSADPGADLSALLRRAGVAHELGPDGVPRFAAPAS